MPINTQLQFSELLRFINLVQSYIQAIQMLFICEVLYLGFPGASDGIESACNVGDPGSIPGWGRSPWEENDNPFDYSCLENFMDRWAWQAMVHGIARVGHNWETFPYIISHALSHLILLTILAIWGAVSKPIVKEEKTC